MSRNRNSKRKAPCHPDRAYFAKDFCEACYARNHRKTYQGPRATCHPDRAARGGDRLCSSCWRRKKLYGLSPAAIAAMLAGQGHKCLICEGELDGGPDTHVDHNHATNEVRGLLCEPCNFGLGAFRDSPRRLAAALTYLQRNGSERE